MASADRQLWRVFVGYRRCVRSSGVPVDEDLGRRRGRWYGEVDARHVEDATAALRAPIVSAAKARTSSSLPGWTGNIPFHTPMFASCGVGLSTHNALNDDARALETLRTTPARLSNLRAPRPPSSRARVVTK